MILIITKYSEHQCEDFEFTLSFLKWVHDGNIQVYRRIYITTNDTDTFQKLRVFTRDMEASKCLQYQYEWLDVRKKKNYWDETYEYTK